MKYVNDNKEDCCGCTACLNICPVNAITMIEDECGFLYPNIDEGICIRCGLCNKTCSFIKENLNSKFLECYAVKHKKRDVVKKSRSGGIFTALSDLVLESGGVIYGAILDSCFKVKHHRAITIQDRDLMRESKYVQSDLDGIFESVQMDLESDLLVLFSGTGCQCDGLKGYLKSKKVDDKKLILCDIICHSNASPAVYKKYIDFQSKKYKSDIVEYHFRDKQQHKWAEHVEKIMFANGKCLYTDEYTNIFFGDDIRPSCYKCKYTSICRSTDITIGDCWGGWDVYPDFVDDEGTSLVLLNTEKGIDYFNKVKSDIVAKPIDIEYVMQPRMKEPEKKSDTYEKFWNDYVQYEFDDFMKKYGRNNYSFKNRILNKIKRKITAITNRIKKV